MLILGAIVALAALCPKSTAVGRRSQRPSLTRQQPRMLPQLEQPNCSRSSRFSMVLVLKSSTTAMTLSTGTIVEEKMKDYVLECIFEHPVHSLVLDTSDACWGRLFTPAELAEIKSYNKKSLIELPANTANYIQELRAFDTVEDMKEKLKEETADPSCNWFRKTVLEYLHLFDCKYFPLTDHTEGDLLRRIWYFIDTVFADSRIDCRGGLHRETNKKENPLLEEKQTCYTSNKVSSSHAASVVGVLCRYEFGCREVASSSDGVGSLRVRMAWGHFEFGWRGVASSSDGVRTLRVRMAWGRCDFEWCLVSASSDGVRSPSFFSKPNLPWSQWTHRRGPLHGWQEEMRWTCPQTLLKSQTSF